MKKLMLAVLMCTILVAGIAVVYDAAPAHAKSLRYADADNKVCPVTGKAIDVKKFNTTYNGSRYWFSSMSAVNTFKTNPEMYLSKMGSGTQTSSRSKRYY